jgi:hypothetical protein
MTFAIRFVKQYDISRDTAPVRYDCFGPSSLAFSFVAGHFIAGRWHAYPHLCPGSLCAIHRWLLAKMGRKA